MTSVIEVSDDGLRSGRHYRQRIRKARMKHSEERVSKEEWALLKLKQRETRFQEKLARMEEKFKQKAELKYKIQSGQLSLDDVLKLKEQRHAEKLKKMEEKVARRAERMLAKEQRLEQRLTKKQERKERVSAAKSTEQEEEAVVDVVSVVDEVKPLVEQMENTNEAVDSTTAVVASMVDTQVQVQQELNANMMEEKTRKRGRNAAKGRRQALNSVEDSCEESHEEKKRTKRERKNNDQGGKVKRERREAKDSKPSSEKFPRENLGRIYLDGNNMMYVTSCLRRLALNKHRKAKKDKRDSDPNNDNDNNNNCSSNLSAEKLLTCVALGFHKSMGLQHTHLCFDELSSDKKHEIDNYLKAQFELDSSVGDGSFILSVARPMFRTTDDKFVALATHLPKNTVTAPNNNNNNSQQQSVFVTSDREMRDRLVEASGGVAQLGKPKKWLELACEMMDKDNKYQGDVDAWLEEEFCNE